MAGRFLPLLVLAAWSCGLFPAAFAQEWAGGAGMPGGAYYPPDGSAGANGYCPPGAQGYCPPDGQMQGYGACPPARVEKPWWRQELLIVPPVIKPPRGTFVRMEYLLWDIEDPGQHTIGESNVAGQNAALNRSSNSFAPQNGFVDNNNPFNDVILQPNLLGNPITFDPDGIPVTALTTDGISVRDNNGVRGTVGIPLSTYGTVELSAYTLFRGDDQLNFFLPTPDPAFSVAIAPENDQIQNQLNAPVQSLIGIPVTIDGNVVDEFRYLGFDQGAAINYKTNVWGTNARYVVDAVAPHGAGMKIRPLFGFAYLNYQETMNVYGFSSSPLGNNIANFNSRTTNNFYGGTVGVRTEYVHEWFTVGIQPAITLGGNSGTASASSDRLVSPEDPRSEASANYSAFAPILEGQAFVRINLSDNVRFNFGYDAMYLTRVFRPTRSIRYNLASQPDALPQGNVQTRRVTDQVSIEGISAGFEVVF